MGDHRRPVDGDEVVADGVEDQPGTRVLGEIEVHRLDRGQAHLGRDAADGRGDGAVEVPAHDAVREVFGNHLGEPVQPDEAGTIHPGDPGAERRMVQGEKSRAVVGFTECTAQPLLAFAVELGARLTRKRGVERDDAHIADRDDPAGVFCIGPGDVGERGPHPVPVVVVARQRQDGALERRQELSGEDVAQNQGLVQFMDRPDTTIVPKPLGVMKQHYGLSSSWPNGTGTIDLGDRAITVIPTPGTHKDGVSFYDPYCDILFTGDLLFPGCINISNEGDFITSLERLQSFAAANPVEWILGGHIDMMFVPGKHYPRFATYKPYERVLEMTPAIIDDALASAREVQGREVKFIRPDFVLFNGVSPDARAGEWPEGVPNITPPRPY